MATLPRRPQTAGRDLEAALAAVEAAYDRLMAAPHAAPNCSSTSSAEPVN